MAAMVDQPTAAAKKSSRAARFCCLRAALFTVYAPFPVVVSLCGNTVANAT